MSVTRTLAISPANRISGADGVRLRDGFFNFFNCVSHRSGFGHLRRSRKCALQLLRLFCFFGRGTAVNPSLLLQASERRAGEHPARSDTYHLRRKSSFTRDGWRVLRTNGTAPILVSCASRARTTLRFEMADYLGLVIIREQFAGEE